MIFGTQEVELVIIGANSSGLLLAAQLLNWGLQPIIIDSKTSSSKISPIVSLNTRSLEVFSQLGLIEEILDLGLKCKGLTVQMRKEIIGYLSFSDFNQEFPFALNIAQQEVEDVLIKYLAMRACPIYWNTELVALKQDSQQAIVEMVRDGKANSLSCKWVVVADESQFQQTDRINYNHWSIERSFYQLDLQTEEEHNRVIHLFLVKMGFALANPVDNQGRYEFVGTFPKKGITSGKYSVIKELLDQALGFQILVKSCNWIRVMKLEGKLASQYLKQRTIVLGNAAFAQPAFLGDEVNNGIQAAHNLGWKLANVCLGKQDELILQSYEEERKAIDQRSYKRNYLLLRLLFGLNILHPKVRGFVLKRLLKSRFLKSSSDYRFGKLSVHHALGGKIKAGDAIPYLPVYDEKRKEETDLHTWCKKPGFVLLLIGNVSSQALFIMGQWTKHQYANHMNVFYLPYSSKNDLVFEAFDIHPGRNKMVLIRPDMHIGYMHDMVSVSLIETYMSEVMGWKF